MVKDAMDDLHTRSPRRGYRSHPRGVKHQRAAGLSTLGASPHDLYRWTARQTGGRLAKSLLARADGHPVVATAFNQAAGRVDG